MTAEIPITYQGEAMLVRWSENHKGRTLTLELDPTIGEKHPFFGLKCGENGQRMQLVCVLVDDHEEPMKPPQVGTGGELGSEAKSPKKSLTRSQVAALKLDDETFVGWLYDTYGKGVYGHNAPDALLKKLLNITSKRELDTNPEKAEAFDRLLADYSVKDIKR